MLSMWSRDLKMSTVPYNTLRSVVSEITILGDLYVVLLGDNDDDLFVYHSSGLMQTLGDKGGKAG